MHYAFHFNVVWEHWRDLAEGAWLTIRLSALAMALGLVVATVCAYAKAAGPSPIRWAVAAYVEAIRNTPFLVQIFIVYFSLPTLGISVGANEAALAAMVVNFGAYGTEILRAGIESIPQGQIEAARALGLSRLQTFRYVVLFPAVRTVFPALSSQHPSHTFSGSAPGAATYTVRLPSFSFTANAILAPDGLITGYRCRSEELATMDSFPVVRSRVQMLLWPDWLEKNVTDR